jgi:hypothetical protein
LKSVFDVVTLGLFAGLAILYLQRSASAEPDPVPIWKYGIAAVGCGVADYLGDHDQQIASILVFAAVVIFSLAMLHPFSRGPSA